jgi:hypothetical protein
MSYTARACSDEERLRWAAGWSDGVKVRCRIGLRSTKAKAKSKQNGAKGCWSFTGCARANYKFSSRKLVLRSGVSSLKYFCERECHSANVCTHQKGKRGVSHNKLRRWRATAHSSRLVTRVE